MPKQRYLVTAALPYANGPLHVGHAIGAYIPADVYSRYLRLKGQDVLYICGTDEHGTPISVTAEKEGITPKEVVDKYHKVISKAFSDLGISFDNFSRTTIKPHYTLSQEFFLKILENGFIYEKTVERPYCANCKRFLPDRYVRGTCPKCEAKDQRGDQCEKCGKQLEPHELIDSYCAICRNKPEQKETKHWFFKLSAFDKQLEDWINGKSEKKLSES
ncbi:MAG: class I tRNA ligase family protein, partial [Candidatus Altiarchaeota archaeon]